MPTDKSRFSLILRHASQLVCVSSNGALLKRGASMNDVCVIEDGALVVALDGRIAFVGPTRVLDQTHPFNDRAAFEAETEVNAAGKAVVPGLVDGHSHPVWAGNRVHEFAEKLSGASYLEIHGRGGGIQLTVRETRNRSAEELLAGLKQRLDRMLRLGTTLLEAKSGYGLDLESEVKLLKVLRKADEEHHVDIVGNYCGAHSVPVGVDKAKYVEEVVSTHMPEIQRLTKLGEISPELIDVFCENGVFDAEDTERIIRAGQAIGLKANFHGDELSPMKAAELAARVQSLAVSHLEHISEQGIKQMAEKQVVGVLLPTTAYILRIPYPPARRMIDQGVPIALGTDFNPNAHCLSMPFTMNLACVNMHMTMNEALSAATLNAAASMGKSADYGSLEKGKFGDIIILDCQRWEHLIYEMIDPPISQVYKKGRLVFSRS